MTNFALIAACPWWIINFRASPSAVAEDFRWVSMCSSVFLVTRDLSELKGAGLTPFWQSIALESGLSILIGFDRTIAFLYSRFINREARILSMLSTKRSGRLSLPRLPIVLVQSTRPVVHLPSDHIRRAVIPPRLAGGYLAAQTRIDSLPRIYGVSGGSISVQLLRFWLPSLSPTLGQWTLGLLRSPLPCLR